MSPWPCRSSGRTEGTFRQPLVWTTGLQRSSADQLQVGSTRHCRTKPVQYHELILLSNESCESINLFCPVVSSTTQPIKTPPNPTKKQGKLTLKVRMQEILLFCFSHESHLTSQNPISLMLASRQSCLTGSVNKNRPDLQHIAEPLAETLQGEKEAKSETKTITNVTNLPA